MRKISACLALAAVLFITFPAFAMPVDGAIGFQPAASPSAERIHEFHHMLLYIITGITLFVFCLLLWIILRYNKWANPVPQTFSHNVVIEILWTIVPVIILIIIVIPSFKLLYYVDRTANPDMTLKVTGYQWYWGYEYPDQGGINFLSYMVPDSDLKPGQPRLLTSDNPVVLPVDTNIQILVTGADVIHSFALPQLGIKIDAMPGRLNETWMRIDKPGTYYGQCSELCGKDHAFMPIEVHAVPKEEFAAWVKKMNNGAEPAHEAAVTPMSAPGTAKAPPSESPPVRGPGESRAKQLNQGQ